MRRGPMLRSRPRSRAPLTAAVVATALAAGLGTASAASAAPAPSGAAPGAPGALSHFGLARKDCLGTARHRTSKVWFTIAGGMLSDVYFPTEDNTNVETMQYMVTRGGSVDLQAR